MAIGSADMVRSTVQEVVSAVTGFQRRPRGPRRVSPLEGPWAGESIIPCRSGTASVGYHPGVAAVVLRGPANTAPESIVGPFASRAEAEEWAAAHPRPGGYSVAEELTDPTDMA
jgi:hypothetical protein